MLAPNIPNARNGIAILALTEDGTTAAVVEVDNGVNAFVFTTGQTRDRASREILRTKGNVTGEATTVLETGALVVMTVAVSIMIIVAITPVAVAGDPRWSRGAGLGRGRGRGRRRVAAEGTGGPLPALVTLRRRESIRWLVRSTAAFSRVPRPVEGAVSVGGRLGGIAGSSLGKTDVLGVPPKTRVSTVLLTSTEKNGLELVLSTIIPVCENERDGENQENDASNERHFGIDNSNERRC